jgi:oligopeptide transport system ATP-binding protein
MKENTILEVHNLSVSFDTYAGEVQAVRNVSFDVKNGELVSIVGESGCGKSVTVQSVIKLLPDPPVRYKNGTILMEGKNLLEYNEKAIEEVRGRDIAMILQDPMTSLNPTMIIGNQIIEGLKKHNDIGAAEARKRAVEILEMVGLPFPEKRMRQYPHEFSGGMRQRVCIAIALSCNPKLQIERASCRERV